MSFAVRHGLARPGEPLINKGKLGVEHRVSIDRDLCIGTGDCARTAPGVFYLDESLGIAVVRGDMIGVDMALLEKAAYECPTAAIRIESGATAMVTKPQDDIA